MKQKCKVCKILRLSECFYSVSKNKGGLSYKCKECFRKTRKLMYDTDKTKTDLANRKSYLKRTYKLTIAEFDEMVRNQNNLCAICNKPETKLGPGLVIRSLCVDHNHITGENRKLLCTSCNVGLGYFRESKEILLAAVAYLQAHEK